MRNDKTLAAASIAVASLACTTTAQTDDKLSDVQFYGYKITPEPGAEAAYADRIIEIAGGLRTCIFVRSAGAFAGHLI